MKNLHSNKYLIIPNTSMRIWELFCSTAAFISIIYLGFISQFIYKEKNFIGMSSAKIIDKEHIIGFSKEKNFIADPADYCPNPPSDTIILLKRITKFHEKIRFCDKRNICDSSCVNFRKAGMHANWCRSPQFFEDVSFLNIEDIDLEFKIIFAGDKFPRSLKNKEFTTHTQSLAQVLSRLTTIQKNDNMDSIILRYYFKCVQNIWGKFNCERDLLTHRIVQNFEDEAGSTQFLEQDERLSIDYYGYSLRTYSSLKILSIGKSNFMVIFAMAYMTSRIISKILAWFFIKANKTEQLLAQLTLDLDLSRHFKTE